LVSSVIANIHKITHNNSTMAPTSTPPHPELRSGLSLLDGSPLPEDVPRRFGTAVAAARAEATESSNCSSNPYESILEKSVLWKLELESTRDEIYWLQVQNCQSLDALCMAGAEIAN
jgi:hypothetical protein